MRAAAKSGAVAVCLLLVVIVVAACGGGTKTTSSQPSTVSRPTTTASVPAPTSTVSLKTSPRSNLQSIFEEETALYTDYADQTLPKYFAKFKGLGVQTLRVFVPWSYLAPDPSATTVPKIDLTSMDSYVPSYWAFLDAVVKQAQSAGIKIFFTVGAPAPTWAQGKNSQSAAGGWKPNAADFGDLMKVLGQRYSGHYTPSGASSALPRVDMWSIWNEPNAYYLSPNAVNKSTPYAPRLYRALVDAAWNGLQSTGHTPKTDTILIGDTAPRGLKNPGNTGGVLPLVFIRALYCVGTTYKPLTGSAATAVGCPASGSTSAFRAANPALFEASGWADHPYSDTSSPAQKVKASADLPAAVISQYADFADLSQLETTLDGVFSAYGSNEKIAIYNTEYGYKTNPPTSLGISDSLAARYMNEAEYLSWLNPRIHSYDQYLLIDPGAGNQFATGLERSTGTKGVGIPKPDVYDAYRLPLWLPDTSASAGQKLQVWGCARPADQNGQSSSKVAIQFAASGSAAFATVGTATVTPAKGGCYFTADVAFPKSGTVRLSYDDDGSTVVSRSQAVTVH